LASAWDGQVLAVTADGPAADDVLRLALGAGAHRAVRVALDPDLSSATVAGALAPLLAGCAVVCCGDQSTDRGSGAVPALLAARLGAAQGLGLLSITIGDQGVVEAVRRLDGGRRERLRIRAPSVISVEGATARLRRASLAATVASARTTIDVVPAPPAVLAANRPGPAPLVLPYRPRPRQLPPPAGDDPLQRILQLTAATSTRQPPRTLALEPAEAADAILEQLHQWAEWEPEAPDSARETSP
jgi:electron transfer flavoprotein beta subunit